MGPPGRPLLAGSALLAAACALASCGGPPARRATPRATTTSTTTTSTTPPSTTTPAHGIAVPDVVGMKIDLARFYLRTAGFSTVPFNAPCNKGTLVSQSVVASLSLPGKPPDVHVGAQPLLPGTLLPKRARVGITWSGCYPSGTTVPLVVGRAFSGAVHLLHLAGLVWACYSLGRPTTTTHPTTTTTGPVTTSTAGPTSSTTTSTDAPATTTSTTARSATVLHQSVKAGTPVRAGTVIALVMHHCPQ